MSHLIPRTVALTALAVSLSGASYASATSDARNTVSHSGSKTSWSDIRVSVSRDGSVTSEKVVYDSGNSAFNASALQAVAATKFVPDVNHANPTTFDYALTQIDGKRSSRILGSFPGDVNVSARAGVRVLASGNAWLAKPRTCLVAER